MMSVSVVLKNVCEAIGEAPHWDEEKQLLYYVDIQPGDVHIYNPAIKEDKKIHIGKIKTYKGFPMIYIGNLSKYLVQGIQHEKIHRCKLKLYWGFPQNIQLVN